MARRRSGEVGDGLTVTQGEDVFPDDLAVDVLEGSLRVSPKDGAAGSSRAEYLESMVDDLATSADADAELPTALRKAVAHLLGEAREDLASSAPAPHLPDGNGADGEFALHIVEGVALLDGDEGGGGEDGADDGRNGAGADGVAVGGGVDGVPAFRQEDEVLRAEAGGASRSPFLEPLYLAAKKADLLSLLITGAGDVLTLTPVERRRWPRGGEGSGGGVEARVVTGGGGEGGGGHMCGAVAVVLRGVPRGPCRDGRAMCCCTTVVPRAGLRRLCRVRLRDCSVTRRVRYRDGRVACGCCDGRAACGCDGRAPCGCATVVPRALPRWSCRP